MASTHDRYYYVLVHSLSGPIPEGGAEVQGEVEGKPSCHLPNYMV
jgi:hypothetical protein